MSVKPVAILQARVASTRLPGKVLLPIRGVPMLLREIRRIQQSLLLREVVVATSVQSEDDAINDMCLREKIPCFRGSPTDVLDRYYQTAQVHHAELIVRLTGDCPLIDPQVIDETIDYFLRGNFDYVSNALESTFPDGLDTEVLRFSALRSAWEDACLPSEREHVTPFIYKHPKKFRIGVYRHETDLSFHRWTVDEVADFEFVKEVYRILGDCHPNFTMKDVLCLLENHPEIGKLNRGIARNEGYRLSVLAERKNK